MNKFLLWTIIILIWIYVILGFWFDFPSEGLIAPYGWWLAIPVGVIIWAMIWVVFLRR